MSTNEARAMLGEPMQMAGVRPGSNYVLRVKGESLADEQIRDGDYLIVNARTEPEDGETVVALVAGCGVVSRYYREPDGRVRLRPSNPTMQSTVHDAEDVEVSGILISVVRKY